MRLLLEAEILAHAVFDPKVGEATLIIPEKNIELHLKNHSVEMGIDKPLLRAIFIFEGEDLNTGKKLGTTLLKELLTTLSYVTSFKFEFYRAIRLIDWTEGTFARPFHLFHDVPGHDLPYYLLTPQLLNSAGALWQASKNHPLETAIHWFSSAVAATYIEDKFQLFWFSLELTASYEKSTERVNDLCAICRSPLYCEVCSDYPTHRPYQKQAIQQLIYSIAGEHGPELTKQLFKIRNMLLHGSTKAQIESELNTELSDYVEDIGHITKQAIFLKIKKELSRHSKGEQLELLEIEGYTRTILGLSALMTSSSIPPNINQLDRLALPKLSLSISEKPSPEQER